MRIRFENQQLDKEEQKTQEHSESLDFLWAKQVFLSFYFEMINLYILEKINGHSTLEESFDQTNPALAEFKNTISSMINLENVDLKEFDQTEYLHGILNIWGRER